MNPDETLAAYLRRERLARGLSLRGLAERAGVSKSALGAWEGGANLPSLPELDAVLGVYGAAPEERLGLLRLVDAPRARREVRRAEAGPFGLAPATSGAVLRTMRTRRGLSLSELSRTLGVDVSTIGRWERGDVWPAPERLLEVLDALDAHPAEREALLGTDGGRRPSPDLEGIEAFLYEFRHVGWGKSHAPFVELRLIGIVADLWPLVPLSPVAERLYRDACAFLAHWFLMNHGALDEAVPYARRALAGDDGTLSPTQVAWPIHILAKGVAAQGRRGPADAIEYLRGWLPRTEDDLRIAAWYRRDIAEFVAATGEIDAALALSSEAIKTTILADESPSQAECDHARLLIQAGRAEEALPLLPPLYRSLPLSDAGMALTWTEALFAVSERDEAHRCLDHARRLIEDHAITGLRPQLKTLTRRLERAA